MARLLWVSFDTNNCGRNGPQKKPLAINRSPRSARSVIGLYPSALEVKEEDQENTALGASLSEIQSDTKRGEKRRDDLVWKAPLGVPSST